MLKIRQQVDGVVKQARTNLTKRQKNASKKLYNSIKGDSKVYPNSIRINIDTAKSKFFILDETELTLQEVITQDKMDLKEQLRKKWNEIQNKDE